MKNEKKIVILYGSQTGTAEEYAENIWRQSRIRGFSGPVMPMDDFNIANLVKEEFVIFVCSTTGLGEEPDNMKKSWKFLLRKSLPTNSLGNLKFCVLGLGDSSYSKFNYPAKKLSKRLLQLGANQLIDIGLCDYQHDLGHDAVADPWTESLWASLGQYFLIDSIDKKEAVSVFVPRWNIKRKTGIESNITTSSLTDLRFSTNEDYSQYSEKPYLTKVKSNIRTTAETHFQDVRLLKFSSPDCDFDYEPGDVFNLRPRNSKEKIDSFFALFKNHSMNLKPNDVIEISQIHSGPELAGASGGFSGGANTVNSQDDEYRWAGVTDPKIMITTSREPSARLKMFAKELRLIFPNSQRMNRGKYEMKQLIHACRANDVTDFIVVHEHRGVPSSLVICHLPYGPTASFQMSDVIMRHDVPDMAPMSEQYPHLVFHNFKTELGIRASKILKYLFPVPKEDSKRVITFANHDDYICFRHHTYKKVDRNIELSEVGPRFQLKLYEIKLGTLDSLEAADKEWVLRPYMNTSVKRRFLSQEDGWQLEDDIN